MGAGRRIHLGVAGVPDALEAMSIDIMPFMTIALIGVIGIRRSTSTNTPPWGPCR